jgi:HK97 family phage major capsid protein
MTLLTRPVVVTEACSILGDLGDIVLADLSSYVVAVREDIRLDRDASFLFSSDQIALRLRLRMDGAPTISQAQTARGGGATNSPFVTLASR